MLETRRDLPVLLIHNVDPAWTPTETRDAEQDVDTLAEALKGIGHPVELLPVPDEHLDDALEPYDLRKHVVFNWCEELPGVPRSEPEVTAILERLGFVFTGSSFDVLSLSHDKPRVKRLLEAWNIPTPPWTVYDRADANGWNIFPGIVKAAYEHCSIGIAPESVVYSTAELERRIEYILDVHKQPALVEEFVNGREFLASAWGNGTVTMLPVAELDYGEPADLRDRVFTYDAKYVAGSYLNERINVRLPADLDPSALADLERIVLTTYRITGCRDYGRIDVRLRDGVFFVFDVNPNPDINPETSLTSAAAEEGYTYGEMGSRIVNLAAVRHPVFGAARKSRG